MSASRPTVLFVGAFPPPDRVVFGGMVLSCAALMQSSLVDKCELHTFDTTQISAVPPPAWRRLLLSVPRLARFMWRLQRSRPDVVLLFAGIGGSLAEKGVMAWYARLWGVPALLFPRGGAIIEQAAQSRLAAWIIRAICGGAPVVLCQSQRWHDFATTTLGRRPEMAPIIPNWTARPDLLEVGQQRMPANADVPARLLFLGWLDREKGVQELLDACLVLRGTHRFTLTLAGDGNWTEPAAKFIETHHLQSMVTQVGWLKGDAVTQALATADILVLPSWAEGLPNAMVEGMAAGMAVVVSRVGSVPDVIDDGRTGLLVEPRDVGSLTEALARVIASPSLRANLGRAAHAAAAERFSVEPAVAQLLEAFHIAMARPVAD